MRVRHHRPRRRGVLLAVICTAALAVTVPAAAHYANFTGSVYQDRYVPGGSVRCLLQSSGVCLRHSFTFASAKDVGGSDPTISARIYILYPEADPQACGQGLVRRCLPDQQHGSNPLDCHDTDEVDDHVVAARAGAPGTTVQMHGGY